MDKLDDLKARLEKAKNDQEAQNRPEPAKYQRETSLGIRAFMEMIGVLLGSGLMGYAFDRFFGTAPVFLFVFVILGVIAAFFNLYKLTKNLALTIGSHSLQSEEKTAKKASQKDY